MKNQNKPISDNDQSLKTPSLCWECARACGGANCPWADDMKPVKGWVSDADTVVYCPRFIKGRNPLDLTDEQIESISTNTDPRTKVCRLHTKLIRNTRGKIVDRYYECPICKTKHENKIPSCTNPDCGVIYLYDGSSNYALSHTNAQLRASFLKDYGEDFPKSKLMTGGK